MKHILLLVLIATFAVSCKNDAKPEVKTVDVETEITKELDPDATYVKAEFTIEGMTCAIGCAATIQKKITKMDGVKSANVDFEKNLAMVEYNDAKVTPQSLTDAVSKVSNTYKVSDMQVVENFSTKKVCEENCTKPCCANKTEAGKMACVADCKKACCTKKA